jgi:hypothetical protein
MENANEIFGDGKCGAREGTTPGFQPNHPSLTCEVNIISTVYHTADKLTNLFDSLTRVGIILV